MLYHYNNYTWYNICSTWFIDTRIVTHRVNCIIYCIVCLRLQLCVLCIYVLGMLCYCSYMVSEVLFRWELSKMAMMNLQSCHILLQKTEEWPKWRCYFEQYCVASRLVDKDETHKVSNLLKHYLGEDAEDFLDTTRISGEDKKNKTKLWRILIITSRCEKCHFWVPALIRGTSYLMNPSNNL